VTTAADALLARDFIGGETQDTLHAGCAVADSLLPGAVIADRYTLLRRIGEGGMASVWAATHVVTRKTVALKFLKPELAEKADLRQRFLREARAATAVRHPSVVQIHDVLELDDRSPVMVMDLLEGESLASRLAREGPLPLVEVARLLVPAVAAIGSAHALGIVHRDLKPENLFLVKGAADASELRVLDFGIAKLTGVEGDAAQSAELTRTGSMLGTLYYMSPEQIYGERDVDHRSDLWALGVILYECLTGRRPTEGTNAGQVIKSITTGAFPALSSMAPDLPRDVTDLVARMLAQDRADRPQDVREVGAVLERFASGQTDAAGAAARAVAASSARGARRAPWVTGAVVAGAGAAAIGVSAWVFASVRDRAPVAPEMSAAPTHAIVAPPSATPSPDPVSPLASIAPAPSASMPSPPVSVLPPTRSLSPARPPSVRTAPVDAAAPTTAAGSARPDEPERGPGGLVVRPGF